MAMRLGERIPRRAQARRQRKVEVLERARIAGIHTARSDLPLSFQFSLHFHFPLLQ
jgi:hypothetical protein